ncbi:MAG: hypothetical protein HQL01_08725 [Nitrospirae bacterium]|nr:hypothetical protein [Nitrospirota bacterium]
MKAGVIHIGGHPEILYFSGTTKGYAFINKESIEVSGGYKQIKVPGNAEADVFYVSLPVSALNCRIIDMPFSDKKKILSTIPFALDGLTTQDVESLAFDCIVTGDAGAIVVYMDKAILVAVNGALRENGIDAEGFISVGLRYNHENRPLEGLLDTPVITDAELIALCAEELKSPLVDFGRGLPRRSAGEIKRRLLPGALLLMALVIVLITYMGLKTYLINKRIDALNTQMSETYGKMFPAEKRQPDPLYALRAKLKRAKDESALLSSASPLSILKALSTPQGHQSGITITGIEMNLSKASIKGEAAGRAELSTLSERLRRDYPGAAIEEEKATNGANIMFTLIVQANTPTGDVPGRGHNP